MGRTTRWLKELFGFKIEQKDKINNNPALPLPDFCQNPYISPAQAAWLTSFYSQPDTDHNIRARALAAATAAAADAAVAAAQAAFAVVRLNAEGRQKWAAVSIQRVFRGYLGRKAGRALRGLVRIQALVRGFLVRKQAAATLRSIQALLRAQATVLQIKNKTNTNTFVLDDKHQIPNTKIVEVDTWCRPKSRSRRISYHLSPPTSTSADFFFSKPKPRSQSAPKQRHQNMELRSPKQNQQPALCCKNAVINRLLRD